MARYYKKWDDHSARWKREQTRKGLSKNRWDSWLKLSESTRKQTDPRKYAAGQSIASQRREKKEQEAFKKIRAASPQSARSSTVKRNVQRMSDKDLDWTIKATTNQIRNKASKKHVDGYAYNPWWYR